jgi:hypothetical protein
LWINVVGNEKSTRHKARDNTAAVSFVFALGFKLSAFDCICICLRREACSCIFSASWRRLFYYGSILPLFLIALCCSYYFASCITQWKTNGGVQLLKSCIPGAHPHPVEAR